MVDPTYKDSKPVAVTESEAAAVCQVKEVKEDTILPPLSNKSLKSETR